MKNRKEIIIGIKVVVGFIAFIASIAILEQNKPHIPQSKNSASKISKQKETPDELLTIAEKYLEVGYTSKAQGKLNKIKTLYPDYEKNENFITISATLDSITQENQKNDIAKKIDDAVVELKSFHLQNVTTISEIIQKTGMFDHYLPIIYQGQSQSPEMMKYTKKLVDILRSTQVKYFPIIRKKYAEIAGQMLWEDDKYVKTLGNHADRIQFIGASYAANRNIKEDFEGLEPVLTRLRFQRVDYKWMPSVTKYTYYSLQSDKDSYLPGVLSIFKEKPKIQPEYISNPQ